jgi:hypothetical protein
MMNVSPINVAGLSALLRTKSARGTACAAIVVSAAVCGMVAMPRMTEARMAADDAVRAPEAPARALVVMTGHEAKQRTPHFVRVATQEVFDEHWIAAMGDRVERAVQGWPLTPVIDFEVCNALMLFGGDRTNSNGYRVLDILDEPDAVTVRVEDYSFQTMSIDGPDHGVDVRPWALIVIPATERTVFIETNVQSLKAGAPKWKRLAAFPGKIGIGRAVGGTAQTGEN